jgi:hypothetical protein
MTAELHRSIVPAIDVINAVAPVTPLWVVYQEVTAPNADESAPLAWSDRIFPVHAIGTVPPITIPGLCIPSGAFLVADPATGAVAWLRTYNFTPRRNTDPASADYSRVFLVSEEPQRGHHPCPPFWGCTEYDPTEYTPAPFC